MDYLQPHVILISVAEEHLSKVRFEFASEWSTLFTIHRPDGKPYHLRHRKIRIGPKQTHMIFGRAAQLPFGTVSHDDLRAAGEALKKQILAG